MGHQGLHNGGAILFHLLYKGGESFLQPVELHATADGDRAVITDKVDGQLYEIQIKPLHALEYTPPPLPEELQ